MMQVNPAEPGWHLAAASPVVATPMQAIAGNEQILAIADQLVTQQAAMTAGEKAEAGPRHKRVSSR